MYCPDSYRNCLRCENSARSMMAELIETLRACHMNPTERQRLAATENHIVTLSRYLRSLVRFVFKNAMGRRLNFKSRQLTPTEYLDFEDEMTERERRSRNTRKDSDTTPNPRTSRWIP